METKGGVYKLIIASDVLHKEIALLPDVTKVTIGTAMACDVRLRKDLFFEPVELCMQNLDGDWSVACAGNLYIDTGDVRKLLTAKLRHGDVFTVKYQRSGGTVFILDFQMDFDYEHKEYNRKINIANLSSLSIGGGQECEIQIIDQFVGADSLLLRKIADGYEVIDNSSRYGIYVNGNRITGSKEIRDRDFFSIAGYSFYLKGTVLHTSIKDNVIIKNRRAADLPVSADAASYPRFNRGARLKTVVPTEKIIVLDPPGMPQKPKENFVMTLLPTIGMLVVTVFLRGIIGGGGMFVIFSAATMGMGIVGSVFTHIYSKKDYKKGMKERAEKYGLYIQTKEKEIQRIREEEKNALDSIYIPLDKEIDLLNEFSPDLFDRSAQDEDFLHIRLGIGTLSALREIEFKKQEKLEVVDELATLPEMLSEKHKNICPAPVTCDFKEAAAIGVTGEDAQLYELFKTLLFDIMIRHYHKDVKLALIVPKVKAHSFAWLRLLPHFDNKAVNARNLACDDDSKNALFEFMYNELSKRENDKTDYPHYIVFAYGESSIKIHPVSKYIDHAAALGFTFVFFETRKALLPQWCSSIINVKPDRKGTLAETATSEETEFIYEPVTNQIIEAAAMKIAPVYCDDISLEGSLAKNISLFETLGIIAADDLDLQERWQASRIDKSMAAPLGVNAKNEITYLDLHEKAHGPHGLVAGTTGSGKSEILQSYILSMATLFHPYEVGFVIIDFKGGGMANQFNDLPHLLGAITNIDGKEIERSLKSIRAELVKRQRLFADAHVNHIDAYIQKYRAHETAEPIPHLILIVDEFAELRAEQPEFMAELISAARIGRSLGVHLILATQKPAGQVGDQIWSNSRFKLCLKVQTKEDSNEMLKSPLAAEIIEPGRAYLQVGNNEIFELFQSAYSGGSEKSDDSKTAKSFAISEVTLSGKRKEVYRQKANKADEQVKTQLEAIIDCVNEHCERNLIERLPGICLPPLPDTIAFPSERSSRASSTMSVPLGIFDNPEAQFQGEAVIDLAAGNIMIIGSARQGKTNLLQTLIRGLAERNTPAEIVFYILDFGSMALKAFEGLGHVGGVVCSTEDDKLANLFKMISAEIYARKEKLISAGVSSFASYKEAGCDDLPRIVLIVDNFTALKELYLQDDDTLLSFCRDGIAVGMTIVITNAHSSGIGYKYLSNFSTKIAFFCNDSNEYGSLFDYCKARPDPIAGRCIFELDKKHVDCQAYLAYEGDKEIERMSFIKDFITGRNSECQGLAARSIPVIPKTLTDSHVAKQFGQAQTDFQIVLGLDYATVSPFAINLSRIGSFAITGRENSGRSNLAKYIAGMLEAAFPGRTMVFVFDNVSKKLESLKNKVNVALHSVVAEAAPPVVMNIEKELMARYDAVLAGDNSVLLESKLLVMIFASLDALDAVCANKEAYAAYKNIAGKYKNMNACVIVANYENANIPYSASEILRNIRDAKHFFIFEDLSNLKIFDVPLAITKSFKKPIEPGDCYYYRDNNCVKLKTALCTDFLSVAT